MNKNQVHGIAKNFEGKVQEGAGKLVNSKTQQAKGERKQVLGKAEEALGDVKAAATAAAKERAKVAEHNANRVKSLVE
jgi:uncharacterized protein YjbJ (UPF0337 family)